MTVFRIVESINAKIISNKNEIVYDQNYIIVIVNTFFILFGLAECAKAPKLSKLSHMWWSQYTNANVFCMLYYIVVRIIIIYLYNVYSSYLKTLIFSIN